MYLINTIMLTQIRSYFIIFISYFSIYTLNIYTYEKINQTPEI